MSEENKDLARRSWEMLVNQQNPDAIDELYTADLALMYLAQKAAPKRVKRLVIIPSEQVGHAWPTALL